MEDTVRPALEMMERGRRGYGAEALASNHSEEDSIDMRVNAGRMHRASQAPDYCYLVHWSANTFMLQVSRSHTHN